MHQLLLQHARFVGDATMPGRLYDLGRYPGMTDAESAQDRVLGELYELRDNNVWRMLDDYEGCGERDTPPYEFERHVRTATIDGQTAMDAAVYLIRQLPPHAARIESGDYVRDRSVR